MSSSPDANKMMCIDCQKGKVNHKNGMEKSSRLLASIQHLLAYPGGSYGSFIQIKNWLLCFFLTIFNLIVKTVIKKI